MQPEIEKYNFLLLMKRRQQQPNIKYINNSNSSVFAMDVK